jgi:hypothetical protein
MCAHVGSSLLSGDDRTNQDRILGRYCPNSDSTERELAGERLHDLARVLLRVARRQGLDMHRSDSSQMARKAVF